MSFGKLVRSEPVWDIREYLGAMGNMMLAGAVLLTLLVFQNRDVAMPLWQVGLCAAGGLFAGLQGLIGFWRFVTTSTKPGTAAVLAIASVFAALLFGGLFGYMGVTMLASALA